MYYELSPIIPQVFYKIVFPFFFQKKSQLTFTHSKKIGTYKIYETNTTKCPTVTKYMIHVRTSFFSLLYVLIVIRRFDP